MRTMRTMSVALLVCLVLAGPLGGSRPGGLVMTGSAAGPTPAAPGDPGGPAGGVAAATRQAVGAVDRFWAAEYPTLSGQPYRPPKVTGGYQGGGGPVCAGRPSLPGNAFYCADGDYLAWDDALMTTGYQQVGAAWVYLIIAHEWGHAIQARLHGRQVSVARELQADCLAGAALAGAHRARTLELPADADTQLGTTLTSIADRYPWTNVADHGDSAQRVAAFNQGSAQGARACLAG